MNRTVGYLGLAALLAVGGLVSRALVGAERAPTPPQPYPQPQPQPRWPPPPPVIGSPGCEFNERDYLELNPDVARAVRRGDFASGYAHFQRFGRGETRAPAKGCPGLSTWKTDSLSR